MDGLISRQAAIDALEREKTYSTAYKDGYTQTDYFKQYNMGLTDGIKALNKLPSAPRWIPCSEKLPEEEKKRYWVCTDTEYQCECRWTNNRFGLGEGEWGWSIFDTPQYSKPIAWMPLPEAWRGEEDEVDRRG